METELLLLGGRTAVADGTYFGTAKWDAAARDYLDQLGLYGSEGEAREHCPVGTKMVRWTVYRGSVTTRRGLGG